MKNLDEMTVDELKAQLVKQQIFMSCMRFNGGPIGLYTKTGDTYWTKDPRDHQRIDFDTEDAVIEYLRDLGCIQTISIEEQPDEMAQ